MASQTPRRALPAPGGRSSQINTASNPNLSAARKASLNALTAYAGPNQAALNNTNAFSSAAKMIGGDGRELDLGDTVDVPGDMHGVVKFIGSVKGKKGTFAGVELSAEFASKGKNDGDVDGIRYFTTSRPGAGIFLPIHRAAKRSSPSLTADTFPPTPTTPSFANFNLNGDGYSSNMPKFSQSVGPGAGAPSPQLKQKGRPSLPRPESPNRRPPVAPGPTPSRPLGPASFSKSLSGASTPRYSPSPAKIGMPRTKTAPMPGRPYSRNNSRLNGYAPISEDGDNTTPTPVTRTSDPTPNSTPRQRSGSEDAEVQRLRQKLEDRDKQLRDQASSLAEMESSLAELQMLIPNGDSPTKAMLMRTASNDTTDTAELRLLLREKNEKIEMLTAEFDNHRADFRSTIDTLEMASGETQRVYDQRIEELMQELREVQERGTDVDNIAAQLKQLEDLVQALEEDVEDARRGEAEARSEVEFLRGEVERGRSELKREREKAAEALKGAGHSVDTDGKRGSREVEQRDDEIRGLKAIIHSLSSAPDAASPALQKSQSRGGFPSPSPEELAQMQATMERLEREKKELQTVVERRGLREEELEREVERLRGSPMNGNRTSIMSDKTATQDKATSRDSKGTVLSWRAQSSPGLHQRARSSQMQVSLEPMAEADAASTDGSSATLWCEICETGGHDILSCTNIAASNGAVSGAVQTPKLPQKPADALPSSPPHQSPLARSPDAAKPLALAQMSLPPPPTSPPTAPLPNPFDANLVAGKGAEKANPSEWCALCERDGHLAMSCPFEDQF